MKKSLIAAALAVVCVTGAQAADMAARTYTKAPVMAQVYSWTGFYVGVNGGYGWKDPSVVLTPNDLITTGLVAPNTSWNNKGGFGGGQIGYNYQFDRQWLVGLEADFQGADIKGQGISNASAFLQNVTNQKVDWFGTVRARLGWVAVDRLLVFGTAGLAYGNVKESVILNSINGGPGFTANGGFVLSCVPATGPCLAGSSSEVRAGWTAGGGLEYAFAQNWTAKAEYLHVDLGSHSIRVTGVTPVPGFTTASYNAALSNLNFDIVRAGVNYKF